MTQRFEPLRKSSVPMLLALGCLALETPVGGTALVATAHAQTVSNPPSSPSYAPQVATRPPAAQPLPRRQPRATDVPQATQSTNSTADPVAREDEELNRKISGICRGC